MKNEESFDIFFNEYNEYLCLLNQDLNDENNIQRLSTGDDVILNQYNVNHENENVDNGNYYVNNDNIERNNNADGNQIEVNDIDKDNINIEIENNIKNDNIENINDNNLNIQNENINIGNNNFQNQNEERNNLENNEKKNSHFTKKKRKRKEKRNDNSKTRRDNLFKSIKIHCIAFIFFIINELMEILEFNSFYKLNKNKLIKDFKNQVQKDFNLKILETTIKDIINNFCVDDSNTKVIKELENFIKAKPEKNNEYYNLIEEFLNLKFVDIIKIFNISKKEFKSKYNFENNSLLKNNKNIKNRKELSELIDYGVKQFLEDKNGRKKKANSLFKKKNN